VYTCHFRAPFYGRIDCQSHILSEEFLSFLERRTQSPHVIRQGGERFLIVNGWRRRIPPKLTDIDAKLADMDRTGISMAALSMNDPGPELFGKDSTAVAVMVNDYIADTVRNHRGASSAWPHFRSKHPTSGSRSSIAPLAGSE
jgi:predicted TIM-barrel fold metal-dependent hydrolase